MKTAEKPSKSDKTHAKYRAMIYNFTVLYYSVLQ